jgi:hypothetical protein
MSTYNLEIAWRSLVAEADNTVMIPVLICALVPMPSLCLAVPAGTSSLPHQAGLQEPVRIRRDRQPPLTLAHRDLSPNSCIAEQRCTFGRQFVARESLHHANK